MWYSSLIGAQKTSRIRKYTIVMIVFSAIHVGQKKEELLVQQKVPVYEKQR